MRSLLLIPAFVGVAAVYATFDGDSGIQAWWSMRNDLVLTQERVVALRAETEKLREEVAGGLQDHQIFLFVGNFSLPVVEGTHSRQQVHAGHQPLFQQAAGNPLAFSGAADGDHYNDLVGHLPTPPQCQNGAVSQTPVGQNGCRVGPKDFLE